MNLRKVLLTGLSLFFSDKIAKIRNLFSTSESFTLPPPPDVPNFSCFKQVFQEEIRKIIMKSPTKSCLLDPWPTFLVKECIDILLPSITRLVNCSLSEGVVPDEFKKAIVTKGLIPSLAFWLSQVLKSDLFESATPGASFMKPP